MKSAPSSEQTSEQSVEWPSEQTSERWKTFSRQDAEINAYLDGTFSGAYRALPVRSLSVGSSRELITFEIVPLGAIQRPWLPSLVLRALRPKSWILSMGPIIVSWLYGWSRGLGLDPHLCLSVVLAVMLFHTGLNLLDDYFDHRQGRDRVNPRGGSRLIQNGWVRARSVFHAGAGAIGLAVLCGLPVVLASPGILLPLALLALLAGLGFSSERARLKYRGLGEVTTFLLAGPLLTTGFVWSTGGAPRLDFVLLGCVFGFIASGYYHLKNIENIMVDSQANARTLAVRLGFDGAKQVAWIFAALSALSIIAFDRIADAGGLFVPALTAHVVILVPAARRLARTPSPLSSHLAEIRSSGLVTHWATAGVFAALILFSYIAGIAMHGGTGP